MANLFAPETILPFLKGTADAVQGPQNQGAVQALLQNPGLLNAVKALTGGAQQAAQGPTMGTLSPQQAAIINQLNQAGQMARVAGAQGAGGQLALPMSLENQIQNAISNRSGTVGQLIDMGRQFVSQGGGQAAQPAAQAVAPASNALLNPQNVNNAMGMMSKLGNTPSVLRQQLPGLAQKAQASGNLLPALGAAAGAVPSGLKTMLANPATAELAALLFGGYASGKLGYEVGSRAMDIPGERQGQAYLDRMAAERGVTREQLLNGSLRNNVPPGTEVATIQGTYDVPVNPAVAPNVTPPPRTAEPAIPVPPGVSTPPRAMAPSQRPQAVDPAAPVVNGVSEVLKALTPGGNRALDVAGLTPGAMDMPVDPMSDFAPSGNTYGYESVLNDPSFSAEAMLGPSQAQAPAPKEEGFFGKLGGALKEIAPIAIQALIMNQLAKPSGGVRDGMTGLTFGATPAGQNPAYQMMVAQMKEAQDQRALQQQYDLLLRNDMAKKAYDADIALEKSASDFQFNTLKNTQLAAMDLLKNNKLNWDAISQSPDYDAIVEGLQMGDINAVVKALEYSPDVKNTLETQGLSVWNAIVDMREAGDTEGAIEALNDPSNQALMAILKLGPSMDTMYTQLMQEERDKLRIQAQLQRTLIREFGATSRSNNSIAAANARVGAANDNAAARLAETKRHNRAMENKKTGTGGVASGRITRKTAKDGDTSYAWLEDSNGNVIGDVSYSQKNRGVGGIELGPATQGVLTSEEARARNFNVGLLDPDVLENADELTPAEEWEFDLGDGYLESDYTY